jgi:ketosteroid isomerase-like protein
MSQGDEFMAAALNDPDDPRAVVQRLVRATNEHDLETLVGCFAEDYSLDAPAHPQRSFRGIEQVRQNWAQIFGAVPDITTRVLRTAVDGNTVWTEMEMSGTRLDRSAHRMRGVFIFGIDAGQIRWARMFLEPLEETGGDMGSAVREQLRAKPAASGGGA